MHRGNQGSLKMKSVKQLFLFVLVSVISTHACGETLSLRADLWCPYTCDPSSDKPGFMIEIAREIFEPAGIKIDYQNLNWARAITEAREGKISGIVGAARADAPDFLFPKTAAGLNSNFFWTIKTNTFKYKNLSSLTGRKIGVINSYSYGEEIDKEVAGKNPAYIVVSGEDALLKMIKMTEAGRLDAFVENPFVLDYLLKDYPNLQDKFIPVSKNVVLDQELFIAFSPKITASAKYAEMMTKGMGQLRKKGKLKKILEKYGLKDWQK